MIRAYLRRPVAVVALAWVLLLVVLSVLAPWIAPYGPAEQDIQHALEGPSAAHPLGTGTLGLDVLSRLLHGGRITLLSTLISVAVYVGVGLPLGLVAAFARGIVDRIILRISDIAFAIPGIVIVLVVLAIWPGDESAAMVALGLLAAPSFARVVRSAALAITEELSVRAARAGGVAGWRILLHYVLPGVSSTVIVHVALFGTAAVGLETGLGFLGLGSNQVTWGQLVAEASRNISNAPWLLVPSGLLIVTFVLALGLIGDGVRDAAAEGRAQAPSTHARRARAGAGLVARTRPGAEQRQHHPDALLEVRSLTVAFETDGVTTPVVTDLDLTLMPGERLGIAGESGSGKSVTIAAILGLLQGSGRATSGTVRFRGTDHDLTDPASLAALRGTHIGLVGQNPAGALDPCFTVGSQLSEVVTLHTGRRRAAARERVLELLALVQLPDPERIAAAYPHELSGGMAQRVGIALALAGEPEVVLADEPTTALDVTVQAEILDVLRSLDAAVVLVTHDWGVLTDLCDRAMVMYAGHVVEHGPLEQLVTEPQHAYTAGLLRANPFFAQRGSPLPALPGTIVAPADWPVGCRFAGRCRFATDDCTASPISLAPRAGEGESRCVHAGAVRAQFVEATAARALPAPTAEQRATAEEPGA